MKILKFNLVIVLIAASFSCKAQSQLQQINNYNTQIIGTWVEEEDNNYKLVFLENGICKEYVGLELLTSYNYSIIGNSCEGFLANNVIYLKWIDPEDSQTTCLEILNVTNDALSLMIIDRGERLFFDKQ